MERTAGRQAGGIGESPRDGPQGGGPVVQVDQCGQQRPGVRMGRGGQHLANRPGLDDPPGVHDGDLLADLADYGHIVTDEDEREPETAAQAADQLEHLRLDRHVQRGRRLVAQQHLRLGGQRDRDRHPLAHATRQLMRICSRARRRAGDTDQIEELDGARPGGAAGHSEDPARYLGDLRADGLHRVQRTERILEHHRHPPAPGPSRIAARQREARAGQRDGAAFCPDRGRQEGHQRAQGQALAGPDSPTMPSDRPAGSRSETSSTTRYDWLRGPTRTDKPVTSSRAGPAALTAASAHRLARRRAATGRCRSVPPRCRGGWRDPTGSSGTAARR
jgi:hypothetical protein